MPIIELVQDDAPLSQGDILRGLKLFETKVAANGAQPLESRGPLCLVLSRPCVAAHKSNVIVAKVHKYAPNLPRGVETFDDMLAFLTGTRDGVDSPDVFYLGHTPTFEGWFCARLDRIHTLQFSRDDIGDFVGQHRVATLNVEFRRDLHLRLFRAFASLGFDDISWLSDEDLATLETSAKKDVADAEQKLAQANLEAGHQSFRGHKSKPKNVEEAQRRLDDVREKVEPYLAELRRRLGENHP